MSEITRQWLEMEIETLADLEIKAAARYEQAKETAARAIADKTAAHKEYDALQSCRREWEEQLRSLDEKEKVFKALANITAQGVWK
jgi:phage shock protein A